MMVGPNDEVWLVGVPVELDDAGLVGVPVGLDTVGQKWTVLPGDGLVALSDGYI